jgi:4-amino-4-deoxy-L-arabinose transferase-like glycosyltransferase
LRNTLKKDKKKSECTKLTIFFNVRDIWIVVFLLGLAFGVRLYMVFHTYVITNDGVLYILVAKLISQEKLGGALNNYFLNLYPFIIAVFQKVFSDWEFSAQMVSAVFGALTVIPLYCLIKSFFNRDVALISSVLFVFHPYLVRFSAEVVRGPTFWFFCMMAVWVGWEAISRKKAWLFFVTSLLGAVSLLLRTEGIFIVPLVTAWILLKDWKTFKSTYKKRIIFSLVFLFTVPILFSPAILYLKGKTGHWHWTKTEKLLILATADIGMKAIKDDFQKLELRPWDDVGQESLEFLSLREFLSLAIKNRIGVIILEMIGKFIKAMHPLLFILLLFGAIVRKHIQYHKEELFLFSAVILLLLIILRYTTVVFPYIATRFMMAPVILCLAWAGVGIVEMEHRIRNTSLIPHLTRAKFIGFRYLQWALVVLIVFVLLPKALASQRAEKIPMKEAGIWIKEHGPKNPVIIGQKHLVWRVAFYANGTSIEMPSDHDLLKYAKEKRVNFLVVNEKKIDNSHLGLNRSFNPDYFKEEVEIGNPSGSYLIKIYSFKN